MLQSCEKMSGVLPCEDRSHQACPKWRYPTQGREWNKGWKFFPRSRENLGKGGVLQTEMHMPQRTLVASLASFHSTSLVFPRSIFKNVYIKKAGGIWNHNIVSSKIEVQLELRILWYSTWENKRYNAATSEGNKKYCT
jgi:hypothetical protein